MEFLAVTGVLLFFLLIVAPIAAIVSSRRTREDLERVTIQIDDLTEEVRLLKLRGVGPSDEIKPKDLSDEISEAEEQQDQNHHSEAEKTEPTEEEIPVYQSLEPEKPELSEEIVFQEALELPKQNLEETLSTKWTVWVGGIALALGAIFLVKYGIDQGMLTPAVRVFLGALFSLSLLGTGEYLRRNDKTIDQFGTKAAHIPGILTGAGIIAGFATVYVSYALFHFIGPFPAFLLLAAVSLISLFTAALHGPWLSALGLLGSFATPILVSTGSNNAWALFSYLGFIGSVSFALAFLRREMWIALMASAGSVFWALMWVASLWEPSDVFPLSLFVLLLMSAAYIFLNRPVENSEQVDGAGLLSVLRGQDWPVAGIIIVLSAVLFPILRVDGVTDTGLIFIAVAIAGMLFFSWRSEQLSILTVWSGLLFIAIYVTWHVDTFLVGFQADLPNHLLPSAPPALSRFLWVGFEFGAVFLCAGSLIAFRRQFHGGWTVMSAVTPVVLFVFSYWKATNFEHSIPFGTAGMVLTGIYILLTDRSSKGADSKQAMWGSGVYAVSAIVSLAFACTMLLEKGWLTVALSLIAPGIAWVSIKRPVASLRYLAVGVALLVVGRMVFSPTVLGNDLGTVPILNWLLYGYGVPAIAFACAAYIFKRDNDNWVVQVFEATSLVFIMILINQQIHHLMNDGDMYTPLSGLAEFSLHAISWLGMSLVLQYLPVLKERRVFYYGSHILGIAGLMSVFFGLLLIHNPVFTAEDVGEGRVFNLLLLAYVLPAIICSLIYRMSLANRHEYYSWVFGVSAFLLMWVYISLMVRHAFVGGVFIGEVSKGEFYSYSAVWLVYGVLLLTGGIWRHMAALRYASCVVIVLTVCKVFLLDMSHLTGLLRALSFIGLGVFLMGVGYFYQKFVFPNSRKSEAVS